MTYEDRIYGTTEINEPVIEALIASDAMQRLKKVNQYGASFYRFSHLTTNRFEHCVGVYLLLRKFNATIEEQIAGLLHDVPHTAFSHVIDFVFGGSEVGTFHEEFHKEVILNSEIPSILEEHGFNLEQLLDKHRFHLLERDLPDVCMDRVDYFFRDLVTDNLLTDEQVQYILNDMTRVEDNVAFENPDAAKLFTEKYLEGDRKLWGEPLQAALYHLFAEAIKIALFDGIITFKDLFAVDDVVYEKLVNANHPKITSNLERVKHIKVIENPSDYDFYIKTKLRIIDPWVVQDDNSLERISRIDPDVREMNEQYRKQKQEGMYLKIIENN